MTKLGEITYNALASDFTSKYPQLRGGHIQFNFSTSAESYTMLIYYNQMSEMLNFSIYNSINNAIQLRTPLAEYPQNLLWNECFNGYALYCKNHIIHFGSSDEVL